jgi:GT2 family glycosyltransferase
MSSPKVTINVVVYNGEKFIRHCLNTVKKQTYQNLEVNIFDNASTDRTREIVTQEFPEFNLIRSDKNLGMWPGQEEALKYTQGEYIVALSVDVMLDPEFVTRSVEVAERDPKLGAIQAKIFQYNISDLENGKSLPREVIDTIGFKILRSRKILNLAHGEEDKGQYEKEMEIFAVEGAVPFIRRSAFEDLRLHEVIIDKEYFWYGDDLDFAWRMRLFGWKQIYAPQVIAWHDRSTTKGFSRNWLDYFRRIKIRRQIPLKKRQLDWANVRFTIIKNDYIINILRDLPYILAREFMVLGYTILFEPKVLLALPRFFRLLPRMISQRKEIMRKAKASPEEIHNWYV